MIEPSMRTYLSEQTTASMYLRTAVQDPPFPYGVVFKVSPGKQYTHSGSGLSMSRLQCSCYSTTYQGAKMMAGNVITKMEEWPQKTTSTSSTGVQAVFLAGELDLPPEDNVYHVATDFFIWHKQ